MTVNFKLAGVWAGGDDVLEFLGRERARQGGESETGWLLVLRRARVGKLRLCSELSTATVRWRRRSSSGWRGEGSRAPARGEVGLGGRGGTAWGGERSRRWPAASHGGGQRRTAPRGEAERERGGRRVDCFTISKNSREPTVSQQ